MRLLSLEFARPPCLRGPSSETADISCHMFIAYTGTPSFHDTEN